MIYFFFLLNFVLFNRKLDSKEHVLYRRESDSIVSFFCAVGRGLKGLSWFIIIHKQYWLLSYSITKTPVVSLHIFRLLIIIMVMCNVVKIVGTV